MSDRKISEPSLRTLSFVLRNKELWPDGFDWNFAMCTNCAMGLAHQMWKKRVQRPYKEDMMKVFGLSEGTATNFFAIGNANTTPGEVADKIDAYLVDA